MTRRFRFRVLAKHDLASIHQYTMTEWGSAQAVRYLEGLDRTFERLVTFPRIAPLVGSTSEVRQELYGQHRIFYREISEGIEIGRILHQSRDFTLELQRYKERIDQQ